MRHTHASRRWSTLAACLLAAGGTTTATSVTAGPTIEFGDDKPLTIGAGSGRR